MKSSAVACVMEQQDPACEQHAMYESAEVCNVWRLNAKLYQYDYMLKHIIQGPAQDCMHPLKPLL